MEKLIEEYRSYLYGLGYTKTKRQQLSSQVAVFLAQQRISSLEEVGQGAIKDFYAYLFVCPGKRRGGAGLSEGTIGQYVYSLRCFFSWLEQTGQIVYNPISGLKFNRYVKRRREPLSMEQIEGLFGVVSDLQELALLHLFYSCGLRRIEAERLDIRDVHCKERLLYVREGKGSKRRVIPLTSVVAADLWDYYVHCRSGSRAVNRDGEQAFMLNSKGSRMRGCTYHSLFKKLMLKALHPLPTSDISLHHLRHSIATHLLSKGMGMLYVKEFLGHSSLDTTQLYAKACKESLKGML